MKLKQIKEFNKETVSNEVAYQIFAIAGLWSSYLREEYKSRGFECKEEWYGKGKGGSTNSEDWNDLNYTEEGYVRTFRGLWLIPINSTAHQFSLDKTGKITCWNIHKKGDLKSISNGVPEYYHKFTMTPEYPCDQIKLVQLYLDLGFYTIQN